MALLWLIARPFRWTIGGSLVVLAVITYITADTYDTSFASADLRHQAAAVARTSAAADLLYGELGRPGTSTQYFAWEMGAYLCLLSATLGVLVGLASTRGAESDGLAEVIRSTGVSAQRLLGGSQTLWVGTSLGLLVTQGVALQFAMDGIEGEGAGSAWLLAAVIAITFVLSAQFAALAGLVAPTYASARGLAWSGFAIAITVRALADSAGWPWLNELSLLGLRALAAPFDADRWIVAGVAVVFSLCLGTALHAVADRREIGGGWWDPRTAAVRRLRATHVWRLQWRLTRTSTSVWAMAVALIASSFVAMGSGTVDSVTSGRIDDGFLARQIGGGDPATGYIAYVGTIVGLAVSVFAVSAIADFADDETSGRVATLLTLGRRRAEPLASTTLLTGGRCLLVLGAAALACAVVAPLTLPGDVGATALGQVLGQAPEVLALAGWAALVVGLVPRLRALAWLPLVGSASLTFLGPVLEAPTAWLNLSVFEHVPTNGTFGIGQVILLGAASVLGLAATIASARREPIQG